MNLLLGNILGSSSLLAMAPFMVFVGTTTEEEPAGELHRYWRVLITENQSGNLSSIVELQMHDEPFGPDLCEGGTALADSEFSTPLYEMEHAFDDTIADRNSGTGDRWASTDTTLPHYIGYDFGVGVEKSIESISYIDPLGAYTTQAVKDIEVQYSDDGSSWTTYWSVADIVPSVFGFHRFHRVDPDPYSGSPHGAHSYWQVRVAQAQDTGNTAMAELEFRATPGGADQATGGSAASKDFFSSDPTYNADKAFDNNASTFCASNTAAVETGGWWIRYDFASPVECGQVSWKSRGDAFAENNIYVGAVLWADSSSGPWTIAWGIPAQPTWTLGEERDFTDPYYG